MRELAPLYYQRDRDYVVDSTKFETAFGKPPLTPYSEAIAETLEWYKSQK
jgi:nucleoside-diphosphate-sugar epimerase